MDMVNISIGNAAVVVVLGMGVVFLGLILLMFVVQLMSKIFIARQKKENASVTSETEVPAEAAMKQPEPAPGTAGELKLYDTDPRDAAMIMAIVADELQVPLNQLRFLSIRQIK